MLNIHTPNYDNLSQKIRLSSPVTRVKHRPLPFVVREAYMKPQSRSIAELYACNAPEIMCVGPYNSGKTYPNLMRLYWLHTQVPGLQSLIIRKKKVDLLRTTLPQWENKILPYPLDDPRSPCNAYGKRQPLWYDWRNGGRTWVGNCDEASGYLSGEYDIAFFCQAEQGVLEDWELLAPRCDGRAGNWKADDGTELGQLVGDCNPDVMFHWIPNRIEQGQLHEIRFGHTDNMLLHRDGDWTPHGLRTVERMRKGLTGVRYRRGFLGEWCSATGVVFDEFDPSEHVIDKLPPEVKTAPKYVAIDFGYDHPFVCLWAALLPNDVLLIYREWRWTRMLVKDHVAHVKKHERYRRAWADHDAENAAQLRSLGVPTVPAIKDTLLGIERMKLRLRERKLLFYKHALVKADPKLRERSMPRDTIHEMQAYSYKPIEKHTGISAKDDIPIPKWDDGIHCTKYLVNGLAQNTNVFHPGMITRRLYRNA